MPEITNFLMENNFLNYLNLGNSYISIEAIKSISEGLLKNCTLKVLVLKNNPLKNEGIFFLC